MGFDSGHLFAPRRHLRRNLRRQCHRAKKALSFMYSAQEQGIASCCSITSFMQTQRIGTTVSGTSRYQLYVTLP
ncbi:hypothetical protein CBI55_02780 [Pseudomonas syringae]|nr:hypothetical protein CBI55_02780 [Pseudomonas syringae]